MSGEIFYNPRYDNSHALIIGINRYQSVPPLAHARNDAEAVAATLHARFGFPNENIAILLDEKATRAAISTAFLRFANNSVTRPDDRLIVFYAGHGHTMSGRTREVGFLVPVDGKIDDLSTLIRWDELTRNADLIQAKHIFFMMDACYGGLALARKTSPSGRTQFLKDMLQRRSRQVLTGGKGDQVVSDGGGTRLGHSIFTSHVLDAMSENASLPAEILSANSLMAYVYERVGNDPNSEQTPHYGFLEGDGDFIFDVALLEGMNPEPTEDNDVLISVKMPNISTEAQAKPSVTETVKHLIANPQDRISLNAFINGHLRKAIGSLDVKAFPIQGPEAGNFTADEISARLRRYEAATEDVKAIVMILSHWAESEQLPLLGRVISRLSEIDNGQAGYMDWINMGWYPILLLSYVAGISALSAQRYDSLVTCLYAPATAGQGPNKEPVFVPMLRAMVEVEGRFKQLPGHERNHTPRSEYLFKLLQPALEDEFLLGRDYETFFDQFEIFLALLYADQRERVLGIWGPPGRFAWKHGQRHDSPYTSFVADARRQGVNWGPLKAGLFGGSIDRFLEVASAYGERLSQIHWY